MLCGWVVHFCLRLENLRTPSSPPHFLRADGTLGYKEGHFDETASHPSTVTRLCNPTVERAVNKFTSCEQ